MNKKGFTLVEILGVIVLLSLIIILIIPVLNGVINKNKEKLYNEQIKQLEHIAYNWSISNTGELVKDEDNIITFERLKTDGYLKANDLINPITNEVFDGCIIAIWEEDGKQYTYFYSSDCTLPPIPTIMLVDATPTENSAFLGGTILRKDIKTLTVLKNKDVPEGYTSWDVSAAKNGSILAWYDPNTTAPYDIIIGGKRGVEGNYDSKYLFSYLTNLTSIDLTNFYTNNVTNMSYMFVENGVTNLDLNHFDTSKVIDMSSMFDTMFNITSLNLSNFDTSKATNMTNLFVNNTKLINLDFRSATFGSVTNSTNMFLSVPTSATIYVKDNDAKTYIQSKFSGPNVIIP